MADTRVKLVLASASPRRLMLLERMGLAPDLLNPTDLDETPKRRETPRRLSIRLAEEKAKAAIHAPQVQALGSGVRLFCGNQLPFLGGEGRLTRRELCLGVGLLGACLDVCRFRRRVGPLLVELAFGGELLVAEDRSRGLLQLAGDAVRDGAARVLVCHCFLCAGSGPAMPARGEAYPGSPKASRARV